MPVVPYCLGARRRPELSLADKVHNLRSILADYRRIGDKLWKRFTGRRDGTLWYYQELLEIYKEKAPTRCANLVEEFERVHRGLAVRAGRDHEPVATAQDLSGDT